MAKATRRNKYGWLRDLPDYRDKLYKDIEAPEVTPSTVLPAFVDLRPKCPPVYDQGQLGSCTANAIAGAIGFMEDGFVASRLFIYYNERVMEGTVKSDSGAQIRDGIKSVNQQGTCPEMIWPYKVSKFATKPPKQAYKSAASDLVSVYLKVVGLQEMKTCLAAGFPFVFGFSVYDAFESDQVAKTGVLNLPAATEQMVGGHAVLCVGYDDSFQRVIVRNSWGDTWGIAGYFTMPYTYIGNVNLANDMWTVRGNK